MTSTAELSSPASARGDLTHGIQDHDYTLDDKYGRTEGRIYLSGVQALVRLPMMQHLRDVEANVVKTTCESVMVAISKSSGQSVLIPDAWKRTIRDFEKSDNS